MTTPMVKLTSRWIVTTLIILITFYITKFLWFSYGYYLAQYWACLLGWKNTKEDRRFQRYIKRDFNAPPYRHGFKCLSLPSDPSPIICIHNPDDDVYISGSIFAGACWEEHLVQIFQNVLKKNKDMGVIDVGANIGQYSLIGAKMGHKVIAIEPYSYHVDLLHEAINLNGFQDNIILLQNAVSDSHRDVIVHIKYQNLGAISIIDSSFDNNEETCQIYQSIGHAKTILLDDIVGLIKFEKAIMKIDIEGHEPRAILHSDRLFEKIYIPYIIMEWEIMIIHSGDDEQGNSVRNLVQFLQVRGYDAYSIYGELLKTDSLKSWPNDIIWKHKDADMEYIKFQANYYL